MRKATAPEEETIEPTASNPAVRSVLTAVEADSLPRRRRSRAQRAARASVRLGWNLIPLVTFVAMVGIWSGAIRVFAIPSYLVPGPSGVFHVLVSEPGMLWENAETTLAEILLGFGLTLLSAIPLGLAIALSPLAKQILYPPAMLLQLLPKVAVAPLFLVWFGFGIDSKVILTLLMTFFPLLIASIAGFQILDTRLLYITRSMGATTLQTFRYLRVPAALPVIFSGVKTSATIAATAAIVAEFVGANKGLGYVLLKGTSTMNLQLTFAVLVILTIIGLVINYAVEFSEWLLTPWQRRGK